MIPYSAIITQYGLTYEYDWVVKNNPARDLPYHNLFHAQCMIENCYDGAQYHNLPYSDTKLLLFAALFHDFDHSGGLHPDSTNIKRALRGIYIYTREQPAPIIKACVCCTEYPFVVEPFTIEQRIIRDADLMQFRYPNWKEMIEVRLKQEMEVKFEKPITPEEMFDGNQNFWRAAKFYTEWGKKTFDIEGIPMRLHFGLVRLGQGTGPR
jgi:hypothetical protein